MNCCRWTILLSLETVLGVSLLHNGQEWGILTSIIMSALLLVLVNTQEEKRSNRISNKRIKDLMERGGYTVAGEDNLGNLMFEKAVCLSGCSVDTEPIDVKRQ